MDVLVISFIRSVLRGINGETTGMEVYFCD